MPQQRIIKKYPNRRLYDTTESRYITLAEVKVLVMQDTPFKVVDSQTEADLTRAILLQIILEHESGGQPLFNSDMLARFIRLYADPDQAAMASFLEQGLDFLLKQQRLVQGQLQNPWGVNPVEYWSSLGQQSMSFWNAMTPPSSGDKDS